VSQVQILSPRPLIFLAIPTDSIFKSALGSHIQLAADAATIVASIGSEASALVDGWRSASHYLNGGHAALEDGYGLLLRAPQPIVEAAKSVLEHHDVRYSEVPLHGPRQPMRALIAGPNCFVITRIMIDASGETSVYYDEGGPDD
jgi:hypothetical protein